MNALVSGCFALGGSRPEHCLVIDQPNSDEIATGQTIALMSRFAIDDSHAATIQSAVRMAGASSGQPLARAHAIFHFVQTRVQYETDEQLAHPWLTAAENLELLIRPVDLLSMSPPRGDCDEFAMLTAAMLLAAGIDAGFVTIAAEPGDDRYSHVYAAAWIEGGWLPLDTSHGIYPGWYYQAAHKTKVWPIVAPRLQGLAAVDIDWGQIIQSGVETTGRILTSRYGQPPAGTYIQGRDGSVVYRQQPGAPALSFPGVNVGGQTSILLFGGLALIGVLILAKR